MQFRLQNSNKSIYTSFLWTFIASITILTVVVSSVFYYYYYSSSISILEKSNMKLLSQISYSSSYMNKVAKDLAKTLLMNDYVKACIYSEENDTIALTGAIHIMDSLSLANTYINSIYIYNGRQDIFTSNTSGEIANSKDFYDHEVVKIMDDYIKSGISDLFPISRKIPSSSINEQINFKNVYTYISPIRYSGSKKIEGAIIINVSVDWLREIIAAIDNSLNPTDNEIMVIDHNGVVISHSTQNMFMENISQKDYIRKILSSKSSYGTFRSDVNGKNYVSSYISPEGMDWKFISITPLKSVLSNVNHMRTFAIIACIIFLLLGFLFSYIASKKLYNPIYKLTNKISRALNVNQSNHLKVNELDYLSNAFSEIYSRAGKLEELTRNNLQFFKNDFLKNILLGNMLLTDNNTLKKLKEFDIKIDFESQISIFILSIDDYSGFVKKFNESDRSIFKFAISNIAKEIADRSFISEAVDIGNDKNAVILDTGRKYSSDEQLYSSVKEIITEIQKQVKHYLNIDLSAAMGYMVEKADSLDTLYEDTINILKYKFVRGKAAVLTSEILDNIITSYYIIPKSKEKALIASLKLGNLEKVKEVYYEIIDSLMPYSYDAIYSTLVYIAYSIYNSLDTLKENGIQNLLSSFFSRLNDFETLEEVNCEFENVFYEIINKLNSLNSKRSDALTNNIINLIHEKYEDKDLCLNKISDYLNMSPIYIGRLFKEVHNKSIAEYLMDVRMEKVKYYMDNTKLPIKDIVEKVGMEMSSYFYTNFKKYFAISVGNYKRNQD